MVVNVKKVTHILVHQTSFPHATITENNDLKKKKTESQYYERKSSTEAGAGMEID